MTLTVEARRSSGIVADIRAASALFWCASLLFLALFAICALLPAIDSRLINGASVWAKPAKFSLSLAVQMMTLAWGLSLLDGETRHKWWLSWLPLLFVTIASSEMLYIVYRAVNGEASHFNVATPLAGALYSLMGMGAVSMMLMTAAVGCAMAVNGRPRPLARVSGLSFVAAAILTVAVGGYLGASGSHWIGGDQTDATGLPLFGWSTTGGDLRPAHFMAMHIMQIVPLAVAVAGPRAGLLAGAMTSLATAGLFIQAIHGIPLVAALAVLH